MTRRFLFAPVFLAAASLLALGCDSNGSNQDLGAMAGEYSFDQFSFIPDSPLLAPVDMTDTLVVSATRLQLFTSGRFTLLYQFEGGAAKFIGGDAETTSGGVRLNGSRDDEQAYSDLLLPTDLSLKYSAQTGRLTATLDRRVNLAAFSDRYKGLPSVEGTLILNLRRI